MTEQSDFSARSSITVGFLALVFLVGGVGYWSINTKIAGAIIASGTIVVENNRQVVQHAEGGTVGKILARNGDTVTEGELLLKLDDRLVRSELAIADLQLVELRARRARLEAERDQRDLIHFPDGLKHPVNPAASKQVEGQGMLFMARRETFERELSQIAERILQTGNQILGASAQLEALRTQEHLTLAELEVQVDALDRGLTQSGRVSQLQRETARLAGEIGRLSADIARFNGEIAGFEIERIRLQNMRREGAIAELRDIEFRELELSERRSSLLQKLDRLDVRAPVSGVVFGSTVFGVNAVVRPAEALMYVVPQDQPLVVNAQVQAIHIDQIRLGQSATLRFSAFNQRLTPVVSGTVTFISADILRDEATGSAVYRVDLAPVAEDMQRLEGQVLLPGMPVEAYLRTTDRTPLSYLTKPLTDYFERAFRES